MSFLFESHKLKKVSREANYVDQKDVTALHATKVQIMEPELDYHTHRTSYVILNV